ncbi:MAG: PDZ domain-containing protein [Acidobacteriota bacterium]
MHGPRRHLVSLTMFTCGVLLLAAPAHASLDAQMMRMPDVSDTQIAFVYAGDIWVVAKDGGTAQRLSTPPGQESFPRFSPDGSRIAFTGNYDGNGDIYVVDAGGGLPQRLTHHPAPDRMLAWYPDGRSILFASPMQSGTNRFNQLYKVSVDGGLPEKLPVPYGEFGSIAADGHTLAYIPISRDFRTWKRYRGGMAPDIWTFDLEDLTAKNLTHDVANDAQPMWHGDTLYFLSDRDQNKRANLWSLDTVTNGLQQLTFFKKFDVSFPAAGADDIVFTAGSDLFLFNMDSGQQTKVVVEVVTDRATLKPHRVKVARRISGGDISPSGKRVVLAARGELFSVPAEHGIIRNLTRTSGVAERYPAWSPDGKQIAYFSDASGEYELTVRPASGSGEEKTLTSMGPGFRYNLFWSPDSKKLAFADQAMNINYYDVDADKVVRVDKGLYLMHGPLSAFEVSWSADSRWLTYSRGVENRNSAVFVYDTKNGELHQVTHGFYSASRPAFDPEGKYLFVLTGRTFRPVYSDLDNSWIYTNTTNVAAMSLRNDVPSPLASRNDEEAAGDEADKDKKEDGDDEADGKKEKGKAADKDNGKEKDGEKAAKDKKKPEPVKIDLDGLEHRLVILPPKAGNYTDLAAVAGKVLYRRLPRTGSGETKSPIVFYDLKEREEQTILADADGYALSADGKKLLVAKKQQLAIVKVAKGQKMDKPLKVAGLEMEVDPVEEWHQIFTDAWRIERDYFYDPHLHGVNWNEMRRRYGALLDHAVTRWDVNFVIGELIAELNSSHSYRFGGDTESSRTGSVGLLGCDFSLENGAYRIAKIIDGGIWDSEVRSPLAEPGLKVAEGDYLLAVNGAPVDTSQDPWAAFDGLGDTTVLLTVNDQPELDGAHDILVHTLRSERRLRNLAWIENNRRKVEEATDGRVGYVYVPSTGINGQTELARMLRGQITKEGMVIDERFNSGGQIPDRFIELMNRPLLNYWAVRDGKDWEWPPVAHFGPKVMLINGWSGSGGDLFPFYFREAGLGPLIGRRTWGGLIGISGAPSLIDGGIITAPSFGIYSKDGEWVVEGHGVEPDIEVIDDPSQMVDGGDPQLDRAVEEVMKRLQDHPVKEPRRPAYTNRAGR